jgi:hypothetical protein
MNKFKLATTIAVLCVLTGAAYGQDAIPIAATPAPTTNHLATHRLPDKKFWAVTGILGAATIWDFETTYYAIRHCPVACECGEGNPIARPFVKAGRPGLYVFSAGVDLAAMYIAYRDRKEGGKRWWILPAIVSGAHIVGGVHNWRLAHTPGDSPGQF